MEEVTEIPEIPQIEEITDEEIEEGWGTIADLIREGKVRYGGVSNFSLSQLERVQAIHPVASIQPSYSMLNCRIEEEKLPFCDLSLRLMMV